MSGPFDDINVDEFFLWTASKYRMTREDVLSHYAQGTLTDASIRKMGVLFKQDQGMPMDVRSNWADPNNPVADRAAAEAGLTAISGSGEGWVRFTDEILSHPMYDPFSENRANNPAYNPNFGFGINTAEEVVGRWTYLGEYAWREREKSGFNKDAFGDQINAFNKSLGDRGERVYADFGSDDPFADIPGPGDTIKDTSSAPLYEDPTLRVRSLSGINANEEAPYIQHSELRNIPLINKNGRFNFMAFLQYEQSLKRYEQTLGDKIRGYLEANYSRSGIKTDTGLLLQAIRDAQVDLTPRRRGLWMGGYGRGMSYEFGIDVSLASIQASTSRYEGSGKRVSYMPTTDQYGPIVFQGRGPVFARSSLPMIFYNSVDGHMVQRMAVRGTQPKPVMFLEQSQTDELSKDFVSMIADELGASMKGAPSNGV